MEDLKVGTGVENLEIIGEAGSFPTTTERVYCRILVKDGAGQSVIVKWYLDDKLNGEVSLGIKYDRMRTYAFRTIAERAGQWRVEIVDQTGTVLRAATFKIE